MLILRIFLFLIITQFSTTTFAASKIIITKITSDFIDMKRFDEVVYLKGNVVIDREDMNVLADHMQVYYNKNKDSKSDSIKEIIANGHVKIFNEEFVATGDTGFYNPKDDNFILEKNVIFNRGSSIAHGEKFIYDLKTKKGNLVGQKNINRDGRVIVIIDDSDLETQKK